jgi:hypothetical protein
MLFKEKSKKLPLPSGLGIGFQNQRLSLYGWSVRIKSRKTIKKATVKTGTKYLGLNSFLRMLAMILTKPYKPEAIANDTMR